MKLNKALISIIIFSLHSLAYSMDAEVLFNLQLIESEILNENISKQEKMDKLNVAKETVDIKGIGFIL